MLLVVGAASIATSVVGEEPGFNPPVEKVVIDVEWAEGRTP